MTESTNGTTLVGVDPPSPSGEEPETAMPELTAAEQDAVRELVRQARASGTALTGPGGLLKQLTKMVVEAALDEEMGGHLGYDKGDAAGRNGGNSRNGKRSKTVTTDNAGPVQIEVPRDRDGTFEPVIVPKRARRLSDLDAVVLSLSAKGLTHGEISAHFAGVYGASVSEDTVSRITDRVIEEMTGWWARPLEKVYAAVFIDAVMVKVRDGQVRNKPVYAAIGVDLAGHKDILGLWAGDGDGESAKFWFAVLTDLKTRGARHVFFVVCDALKGLPDSVNAVFPAAIVHTCVIHLIRGTLRYASRKYWDELARDLKPIYQAPTVAAAEAALDALEEKWGGPLPGDDPVVARRLDGVHPVPGLRRGDPAGAVLHERDRVPQRPVPSRGPGPGALPHRTGRAQVPVPGRAVTGPQGHRSDTMGRAVEARPKRVRHHLRRPHARGGEPVTSERLLHR